MRWMVFAAVLWVSACPAWAQTGEQAGNEEERKNFIYEWTDSQGAVHITDRPDKVPKEYRPRARRTEAAPGQDPAQSRPGSQGAPQEGPEALQQAEWRERVRAAKQALADAERRYRELEAMRNELLVRWGGGASGRLDIREEAERVALEMKQVQDEIDKSRYRIEVLIPDEARKAGVPPGWLRE